jgi:flagellar basal body rod protein FlgG
MGSQKTLTKDKYSYNGKEFQVYKTKKGVRLIKINNNFVNINNVAANAAAKINDKNMNDIIQENISELSNLDICEVPKVADNTSDSEVSIDGEEYIIL